MLRKKILTTPLGGKILFSKFVSQVHVLSNYRSLAMQTPGTNIHMHEMTYISSLGEPKAAVLKLQSRDQQRQYHLEIYRQ